VCFTDILATTAIIYFGAPINFSAVPVRIHCADTQREREGEKLVGKKRLTIKEEIAYKKKGVHQKYRYL